MIEDSQLSDWLRGYASTHEQDSERQLILLRCAEYLHHVAKIQNAKAHSKERALDLIDDLESLVQVL